MASVIKELGLSKKQILQIVNEWYTQGMCPDIFQNEDGQDLEEYLDIYNDIYTSPSDEEVFYEVDDVKKKDEIGSSLVDIFDRIGIVTPDNFEEILQYVFEYICEVIDPIGWNDEDVAFGFRCWIESNEKK